MTHVIERIVTTSLEHDALAKPSPAHRLDKATGGIVAFVKTLRAAQGMQDSFAKDRSVYKRYAYQTVCVSMAGTCTAAQGTEPLCHNPLRTRFRDQSASECSKYMPQGLQLSTSPATPVYL